MYDIPFLDLPPLNGASGTVRLPGSKSISNRVLLLAGLAEGTTIVHDLLGSDDTRVMLDALRLLGCSTRWRPSPTHRCPHPSRRSAPSITRVSSLSSRS